MAVLSVLGTGSRGNCYTLTDSNNKILVLDCGISQKSFLKGIGYQISDLVGCLLSHEHVDHFSDAHKSILSVCSVIYTNNEFKSKYGADRHLISALEEKKKYSIGEFQVIPFYLPHSMYEKETGFLVNCPNYGYLIYHPECGKILYATDMEYLPQNFQKQKINHMIIECNYVDEMVDDEELILAHRLKGHCSLSTCIGAIKANMTDDLRTVTLIHLSGTMCDKDIVLERVKEVVPENVIVNIAEAGLQINLEK